MTARTRDKIRFDKAFFIINNNGNEQMLFMKKLSSKLFIILSIFFLISCGGVDLDNNKKDQENENPTQNEPLENNPNEEEPIDEPVEKSISLKVDYLNDGGANIPTTWNDEDDENTSRTASFKADEIDFSFDFVGKWYLSTNKEEYQCKKSPKSYLRSNSEVVVKKIIVETFEADMKVYLTDDCSLQEVNKKEATPLHSDGTAFEYEINSSTWSILAFETYKGSNINIYSFTFYF